MIADASLSEIRLPAQTIQGLEAMLARCVIRLLESKAPESRALGAEAEACLLEFVGEVARYRKLVELHGGDGRRPEYQEPAPAPAPASTFKEPQ